MKTVSLLAAEVSNHAEIMFEHIQIRSDMKIQENTWNLPLVFRRPISRVFQRYLNVILRVGYMFGVHCIEIYVKPG